jgi:hypothetical protein
MPPAGRKPQLIGAGRSTELTRVRGTRLFGRGDIRFGPGWLLDPVAKTVTRERLAGCRRDSIHTDARGWIWCLDPKKKHVAWSRDGGTTWERHPLSDSYFEYCSGGTLGADLTVQGHVVTIGLWRADFSLDRGRSWQHVALPVDLVGAYQENPFGDARCTRVKPLADGRLVIDYFRVAVAHDATNTRFSLIRTPPRTRFVDVHEGVLVAASRRPYGDRFASYDGGRTWRPIRINALLRHMFPNHSDHP